MKKSKKTGKKVSKKHTSSLKKLIKKPMSAYKVKTPKRKK